MSIAEFIKDPPADSPAKDNPQPADAQKKQRREMMVVFVTVVAVGLMMAGTYVAYRIATGSKQGTPVKAAAQIPQQVAAQPAAVIKPTESKTAGEPVESKPAAAPPLVVAAPAKSVASSAPTVTVATQKPTQTPTSAKLPPTPPPTVVKQTPPPTVAKQAPTVSKSAIATAPPKAVATSAPAKQVAAPTQRKEVAAQAPEKRAVATPTKDNAVAPAKVAIEKASREFRRRDVNPRPGERYWQIAAYGQRCLGDYLKVLAARGFQPLVAPGPSENIFRVFVGPFASTEALEQAHRSIQSIGIEPILRSY